MAQAAHANDGKDLKVGKPDIFDGSNSRSFTHRFENIFVNQGGEVADQEKIQYTVSYMKGAGSQSSELMALIYNSIKTFE